jgi:tRNA G18 (ribose-2'-O)-methylase SpoU
MPTVRLDHLNDPRVEEYRAVRDPLLARQRDLFVAEGRLVVERVVASERYRPQSLLLSDAAANAMSATIARLPADVPVYVCAASHFLHLTGADIHRGCLALVRRPQPLSVEDAIGAARTVVVLEAVANPDNIGGVFRNAAAFGAGGVLLSPSCADPLYRKAIRTSMAATLRVPFARVADWPAGLRPLRARGFATVALTPRLPARTLDDVAPHLRLGRLALLLGAEGGGLSAEARALADVEVRIPVIEDVDSLNVAVAAAIALFRLAPLPR